MHAFQTECRSLFQLVYSGRAASLFYCGQAGIQRNKPNSPSRMQKNIKQQLSTKYLEILDDSFRNKPCITRTVSALCSQYLLKIKLKKKQMSLIKFCFFSLNSRRKLFNPHKPIAQRIADER